MGHGRDCDSSQTLAELGEITALDDLYNYCQGAGKPTVCSSHDFHPKKSLVINTTGVGATAIFEYQSICIDKGITLRLEGTYPVVFKARHHLTVNGTIDASGGPGNVGSGLYALGGLGGAGGGAGGIGGLPGYVGTNGAVAWIGGAGGIGGAIGVTGAVCDASGYGGVAVGGGGGGGGSGVLLLSGGGGGGGGGGGVYLCANETLVIRGSILVNGGTGGVGQVVATSTGGAGGGGAGGAVWLQAPNIVLEKSGVISAAGGMSPVVCTTGRNGQAGTITCQSVTPAHLLGTVVGNLNQILTSRLSSSHDQLLIAHRPSYQDMGVKGEGGCGKCRQKTPECRCQQELVRTSLYDLVNFARAPYAHYDYQGALPVLSIGVANVYQLYAFQNLGNGSFQGREFIVTSGGLRYVGAHGAQVQVVATVSYNALYSSTIGYSTWVLARNGVILTGAASLTENGNSGALSQVTVTTFTALNHNDLLSLYVKNTQSGVAIEVRALTATVISAN